MTEQLKTLETTETPVKIRKQRSDKGKPRGKYGPRKPITELADQRVLTEGTEVNN